MRHVLNFILIICFLIISSCAVFVKKHEYKETPKTEKIDVLYVSMSQCLDNIFPTENFLKK